MMGTFPFEGNIIHCKTPADRDLVVKLLKEYDEGTRSYQEVTTELEYFCKDQGRIIIEKQSPHTQWNFNETRERTSHDEFRKQFLADFTVG